MTDFYFKKPPYNLTSHAGLALVGQYMKRLGFGAGVDRKFPVGVGQVRHGSRGLWHLALRLHIGRAGHRLTDSGVCPHSQHTNGPHFGEHLVHHPVLDIDATRMGACKIADQIRERWRILKWIGCENPEQILCLWLQSACNQLLCILQCLLCKHNLPTHHLSAFALFARGSAMPALMDSRMPGTASRNRVS